MSKLRDDIHLHIAHENRGEVWEMEKLMDTIKIEIEAREASKATKVNVGGVSSSKGTGRGGHSTASALMSGSQNVQCVYCKGNHFSALCQVTKNVEERKAVLRRDGHCFVRLKLNHMAKDCDFKKNFKNVTEGTTSLCDPNKNNGSGNSENQKVISSTNTSNCVKKKEAILLQSAKAVACDVEGTNKAKNSWKREL